MDNILSPEKLTHTWLEDTLALLFGTLMISFGIILFRQAGALTGGTAGMAFLIHYATHLPFGVVFFAINLPFYWLSVRRMGAAFTLKTFCAVGLVSLFSDLHDPCRSPEPLLRHPLRQHHGRHRLCGAVPP